jgi:hypothetical protein
MLIQEFDVLMLLYSRIVSTTAKSHSLIFFLSCPIFVVVIGHQKNIIPDIPIIFCSNTSISIPPND